MGSTRKLKAWARYTKNGKTVFGAVLFRSRKPNGKFKELTNISNSCCIPFTTTTSTTVNAYDADAQAFFTALESAGYTFLAGEKNSINTFVVGLKSASLWTAKTKAFYPLLGTAFAHAKWNLKNPVDSNAAYRLVSTGTFTYANGVTCTSGGNSDGLYTADLTDSVAGQNDNCTYVAIGTNVAELKSAFGTNNSFANPHYILPRTGTNETWMSNFCNVNVITGETSSIGRWYNNRSGASTWKNYKNGSVIGTPNTASGASGAGSPLPFIICNGGNGTLGAYTGKVLSAGVFSGLTDGEVATLDGLISALHASLGK